MTSGARDPARPPVSAADQLVVSSLLRDALLSLDREEYEQAEKTLRQALARVPEHAECLGYLAICLACGHRKYVTAERLARRAVKAAPDGVAGYYALGRINQLGGRKQQSHRYLVLALKHAPDDARIKAALAQLGRRRPPVIRRLPRSHPLNVGLGRLRAYLSTGSHLALVAALILVTIVSLFSAVYSRAATPHEADLFAAGLAEVDSLLAGGDAAQAARTGGDLVTRWEASPHLVWQARERLAIALLRMNRPGEAVLQLEEAIRGAPLRAASLHLNLAAALMALEQRGRAFAEFQEAVALDPENWRARVDYGQALLMYRQWEASRRQLDEALRLCGDCAEAQRALARLLIEQGDHAAARPLLEHVHARRPDLEVRRSLALARLRAADAEGARALLLPDWPDRLTDAEARIVLEADRLLGEPGRAQALAMPLASAPPGRADPDLWALVSLVCLEAGLDAPALAAIEAAIALDPQNAAYRNNRVVLLTRAGRQTEADAEWAEVIRLDPTYRDKRR